ncbi:MAG: Peptide deformylase (EC [uncultured Sulfurovum sp.]|uniref:Peptide deformylase n=1 Tax=uncultured Sulfurovum sp. TaxID=269237 RepID=A0A6S6TWZ2_9BACT|nr:MAG: Peptide deformylase (EC [uncultured Sulfurovum sp.]
MVKDIVVYPDKRLKTVSTEVTEFNETLHTLLDDMYETMVQKKGVGLAAIQVGVPKRVLIVNLPESDAEDVEIIKEDTLEIINPIFTNMEGSCKNQEGCLSVPGFYEDVERFSHIVMEYQDRHGEKKVIENQDFLAIALQHEMDHLNGKVFIEKLSILKRKKFEKEWKKRQKS